MLPFRRVLFPVDYSGPCNAMTPYVAGLVRHYNAELTLVHAYGPNNMTYVELLAADMDWPVRVRAFEEERLKRFGCAAFPSIHFEMRIDQGEPGAAICKTLEREGADLVMMPTRGEGAFRRLLMGSVTAKVLHDSSTAVWTSTGLALKDHEAAPHYQSILCALDETSEAEAVLRAAASVAKSYNAELFLVHAIAAPPVSAGLDVSSYRADLIDSAERYVRELKAKVGVDAPHLVTDAHLIHTMREVALRIKADLLVVGRGESQSAMGSMWSVLYPLIRESPCPVLSI